MDTPIHLTSADLGLTHCNQCGECCRRNPCVLVPDDVPRIGQNLGLSARDFAQQHLQIERTSEGQWLVRMRRPCHFLRDSRCLIHDFKPTGGREFECWTPETHHRTYWWDSAELQRIGFRAG